MEEATLDENRPSVNGWTWHTLLRKARLGPCRLPETTLLTAESLVHMLAKFPSVLVKPLDFPEPHILCVAELPREESGYQITAASGADWGTTSLAGAVRRALTTMAHRQCIVQENAPLVRFDGRPFHVRVSMQRGSGDEWTYAGAQARTGPVGGIVPQDHPAQGPAPTVPFALARALPDKAARRRALLLELKQVGYAVTRVLDKCRHLQTIALDFGIDGGGQLWLMDVTTNDTPDAPPSRA